MTMHHTSPSLLDIYGVATVSSPVVESASPAAAMRLALDRQRMLQFSLRHHRHPLPNVSSSTAAANGLLNPSAFCVPLVSISHRPTTRK